MPPGANLRLAGARGPDPGRVVLWGARRGDWQAALMPGTELDARCRRAGRRLMPPDNIRVLLWGMRRRVHLVAVRLP